MTNNNNAEKLIIDNALRAAWESPGANHPGDEVPEGRELEILFYGMMCFDPLPGGSGYRVLFPNGLDLTALTEIPIHSVGLWVRDREEKATARWSGFAHRNDFFVNSRRHLTITGLVQTPLDTAAFEGRVTNLQDCDPQFQVSDDPDVVLDMIVDRGTLSAHVVNDLGMIVVKWTVQGEKNVPVRFTFGGDFVEIPANVKQVFLTNVSPAPGSESERHFQLFRKLAASPERELKFQLPRTLPTATIQLPEPTFGYTRVAPASDTLETHKPDSKPGALPGVVGAVPFSATDAVARTPDVVCSAVVSRARKVA